MRLGINKTNNGKVITPSDRYDNPIRVLVFDRYKRLVAIFCSFTECSAMTGVARQFLQRAAEGIAVMAKGYYVRALHPDVTVEDSDLRRLSLLDYDRDVLHEDRRVYRTFRLEKPAVLESKL